MHSLLSDLPDNFEGLRWSIRGDAHYAEPCLLHRVLSQSDHHPSSADTPPRQCPAKGQAVVGRDSPRTSLGTAQTTAYPVPTHCAVIGPRTGTTFSRIGSIDDAFGADIVAGSMDYGAVDGET
ncbi:uncharacterized protein ARMOST_08727 [Armillaria ostoyae]|uniref:Uncharacterized protein n=1 Tax=Armillaria ostoyae TaxID=47428 RepID=A0A284R9H3_ARMOS|nr:uncharacterized protein ARMOST_08727 [Armillaria ostoyae]